MKTKLTKKEKFFGAWNDGIRDYNELVKISGMTLKSAYWYVTKYRLNKANIISVREVRTSPLYA